MVATSSDLMVATSMICPSVATTENESNSAEQLERETGPSNALMIPGQSPGKASRRQPRKYAGECATAPNRNARVHRA